MAMKKLTDQTLLTKVAIEGEALSVRLAACLKLGDSRLFAELVASSNPTARLYASVFSEVGNVVKLPKEHRLRHFAEVVGILSVFLDPVVKAELGDVAHVNIAREIPSAYYSGGGHGYNLYGEAITMSVRLTKTRQVFSGRWSTVFPSLDYGFTEIDGLGRFCKADDRFAPKFAGDICRLLPASTLAMLATGSEFSLRRAAVEQLTDQALLAKIAAQDANITMQYMADRRLYELRRSESQQH